MKDHGSFIESISARREWVWLSLSSKNDSILQELPCLLESSKKGAVTRAHVLSPCLSPVFISSRLSIWLSTSIGGEGFIFVLFLFLPLPVLKFQFCLEKWGSLGRQVGLPATQPSKAPKPKVPAPAVQDHMGFIPTCSLLNQYGLNLKQFPYSYLEMHWKPRVVHRTLQQHSENFHLQLKRSSQKIC